MVDRDVRLVLAFQAARAFGYGLTSVLVASSLVERGLDTSAIGLVLASMVAGTVAGQLVIARWADRWGRRRTYAALSVALGLAGVVFAVESPLFLLAVVSLTGAMSTEVIESGPFTSLELAMLAGRLDGNALTTGFGWYNAIAAVSGSVGAAAAGLPSLVRTRWPDAPLDRTWLLLVVPVAAVGVFTAGRLSAVVEASQAETRRRSLGPSRSVVLRLSGLFAVDSFAGGFVVQTFIAVWLIERHGVAAGTVGALFAVIGIVQTGSFLLAPVLARRLGLLTTMVFTHLPSNLLLAAVAFAPDFTVAAVLLVARAALSQMDVPTRQAYVLTLVAPEERTAAISYTNTVRYLVRPIGPLVAGAMVSSAAGLPFLVAGGLKSVYDLTLWRWFRRVPIPDRKAPTP